MSIKMICAGIAALALISGLAACGSAASPRPASAGWLNPATLANHINANVPGAFPRATGSTVCVANGNIDEFICSTRVTENSILVADFSVKLNVSANSEGFDVSNIHNIQPSGSQVQVDVGSGLPVPGVTVGIPAGIRS
jgi:hypothetical protein